MKLLQGIIPVSLFYFKYAIATSTDNLPNGAPSHNPEEPNPHRYIVKTSNERIDIMSSSSVMGIVNGTVTLLPGVERAMVVEFEYQANADEFMRANENSDVEIEVDQPRYASYFDKTSDQRMRKLVQTIPWGINKVFEDTSGNPNVPLSSYFPGTTSHPVCIIDSGIELSHPDLPNDVSNADPGQESSFRIDSCGHGTHVAGTIIANDNGEGVIGVYPNAPGVKIVKVFGGSNCNWSYSSTLMQAVNNCADSGAKIISMSLGGGYPTSTEQSLFDRLYNNNDVLIIAAAGNDGNSQYSYPASYPSVVSVGATDMNDDIAPFSQYNDQVDITAPGVNVISTEYSDRYTIKSGTSMATPHVSGVVLLLWSKYPYCTNTDIRNAIEISAKDLGAAGRDNRYGNGLVNYWSANMHMTSLLCANSSPTSAPTLSPSTFTPTLAPALRSPPVNNEPTSEPTTTTNVPTAFPTTTTLAPTLSPTTTPTSAPTLSPSTSTPTLAPALRSPPVNNDPTSEPTKITNIPTAFPTTTTPAPTLSPTTTQTSAPTRAPQCIPKGSSCSAWGTCGQCCNGSFDCNWWIFCAC